MLLGTEGLFGLFWGFPPKKHQKLGPFSRQKLFSQPRQVFTDLLTSRSDAKLFLELLGKVRISGKSKSRNFVQVTLKGSYGTKIGVTVYVSCLPKADGETRYFLGIAEACAGEVGVGNFWF